MAQKKSSGSGCLTAVILVVVLGGIAAIGIFSLFFMRNTKHRVDAAAEETRIGMAAQTSEEGTIIFQENNIPRFPPHKAGEELTREQFVARSIDDHATDLMRAEFAKTADGASVKWLLRTEDIRDRNGTIEGSFSLPYEIHRPHGMRGSSVNINCTFVQENRASLLKVRRGDWVLIQGKLSFNGHGSSSRIEEARILDDSTPPFAESP